MVCCQVGAEIHSCSNSYSFFLSFFFFFNFFRCTGSLLRYVGSFIVASGLSLVGLQGLLTAVPGLFLL